MNPEFQRYVWLELTPHRLLVAPLLLGAIFALVYVLNPENSSFPLAVTGYWITLGLGILWGARNASEAVIGELREGTWDQQRLSALGPWSMTWGKLFGAPVFMWYASVPALLLVANGAVHRSGFVDAISHVVLLIALVVFSHAVGLLVSLQLATRSTAAASRSMIGLHLLGLAAGVMLAGPAYTAYANGWDEPVTWYATAFAQRTFTFFVIGSLVFWATVGCYRMMRTELQLRNAPWVWLVFVVYCMAFAAGFAWNDGTVQVWIGRFGETHSFETAPLVAYLVAMALAVAMLFIEPKDPVEFRRLIASLRDRQWTTMLQTIPRWFCVLPIAVLVIVALILTDSVGAVFCLSIMAFFARDAGIVVCLNLSVNRRRADAAALMYLLVLYGLLPAIIRATSGFSLEGWLFPAPTKDLLAATLPALLQALLVWVAVTGRWRRLWAAQQ